MEAKEKLVAGGASQEDASQEEEPNAKKENEENEENEEKQEKECADSVNKLNKINNKLNIIKLYYPSIQS